VIITKIDLTPTEITKQTVNSVIQKLTLSYKMRELILVKEGNHNKNITAENMFHDKIIPIFLLSNVSGEGLDFLREFIGTLISRIDSNPKIFKSSEDKFEFVIDRFYKVPYCGMTVSGIVTSGKVKVGSEFLLGPSSKGKYSIFIKGVFLPIKVKSIHFKRTVVDEVSRGNSCSICYYFISSSNIENKKGMVLIDKTNTNKITWEFEGEISVVHNPYSLKSNFKGLIFTNFIRKEAKIVSLEKDQLISEGKGNIKFRFISSPEYLHIGSDFIFRQGRIRAFGTIKAFFPIDKLTINN